jgi:transposase InsO family protein
LVGAAGPAIVPETIVIDHGKIYVSEHFTSVCQQMGISIQPARLRTGRDKGPVERFFRRRRYNGPSLNPYRNMTSPYTGKAKGRWPIHYDPDDITRAYFRDPDTHTWHTLMWEHAPSMKMPLSEDALLFARKLAAAKYTYPDDRLAVADLLEWWNLGLGSTLAERRMALRLSREAALIDKTETKDEVVTLPSVARVLAATDSPAAEERDEMIEEPDPETGDDDGDDDLDDYANDFYADALEDA